MKNILIAVVVLLVGGCGTTGLIRDLTPEEEKVVGTYVRDLPGLLYPYKLVLKRNGRVNGYTDLFGSNLRYKWMMVNGEIHTHKDGRTTHVFRINSDGKLQATKFIIYKKIK